MIMKVFLNQVNSIMKELYSTLASAKLQLQQWLFIILNEKHQNLKLKLKINIKQF